MKMFSFFRIMPMMVIIAALSFGVRFGEMVTGVSSAPKKAQAQVVPDEHEGEEHGKEMPSLGEVPPMPSIEGEQTEEGDFPELGEVVVENPGVMEAPALADDAEKIDWRDAGDTDFEFSEAKMELFQDLSKRRAELQERERELAVREALLKTAEQELGQKYDELVSLRSEIQELLVQQSEEEKNRVASLVKIYEGMKPKDAARIFNTLDIDVLLSVVSKMSERKSAPIIASMTAERARTLTIMLMEQKSLPTLSNDIMQQAN